MASLLPRLLAGATAQGMSLSEHLALHGHPEALDGPTLIAEVERAGLRGRGGAAFPTAAKMAAVAASRRPAIVVVNGAEGEPASDKDALLLASVPHLVLDGAEFAAQAVGAREAIVCLRAGAESAHARVKRALGERGRSRVRFRLVPTPDAYLAGEESALVRFLNGGPPKPTFVPPRPYERGVGRRPTLVQNVETLAHLALIARHGADWFREVGTDAEPGSTLVTLTGAVLHPGVYEIEAGVPLRELVEAAGGLLDEPRAILLGGYFGSWVDARELPGLVLERQRLLALNASLGSGVIFVLPERACGVAESARALAYMAREAAGQCGPCTNGLPAIADGFARVARGLAERSIGQDIQRWSALVHGRGACHHPNGAARLAVTAVDVFADELEEHRDAGPCPRCSALPVLPVAEPSPRAVA